MGGECSPGGDMRIEDCACLSGAIRSKNAAIRAKPPYAVIFLLVKAILTLFTWGEVVEFLCIVSFLLSCGIVCLETIDSTAKGGFLLRANSR